MGPTDIQKLLGVGRPSLASHGDFAVFSVTRPDLPANRMVGQLWRIDLPSGAPRRLTRGVLDTAPRLSPDDTRLAFLRPDAKGRGPRAAGAVTLGRRPGEARRKGSER